MRRNRIISTISIIIAAIMILSLFFPLRADAKGYWSADIFTADRSKKGTQSFKDSETKDTSNIFLNAFIETSFPKDDKSDIAEYSPFVFEGETYYFKIPEGLYDTGVVYNLNKEFTVTVQLMLRYDAEKARLVEPSARAYKGYSYYAPNMTEAAVVKEYRAYMEFLSDLFSQYTCHVDAWVCGNEVNAPDSWNFFGTDCMTSVGGNRWVVSNRDLLIEKYCKFYDIVFNAVKSKNKKARVCLCVDHCWRDSDGGKVIPTKTFIDMFSAKEGRSKDWCIAYHCYPADLYQPDIWSNHQYNPKSINAQFVDGYNLEILTGYVKDNYGSNHRILLTEQGFTDRKGADKQAACLVYTFYKAKFDDMVDVMHIMKFQGSGFELSEPAATIWKYLDDGNAEHEQWIFDQVKGTIGVNSWTDIVPNWKSQASLSEETNNYKENNKYIFDGIDYSPVFDFDYYVAHNPTVVGFYTNDPVNNPPKFDDMFYYFTRYGMDMGQDSSPNFKLDVYKANHPELVAKYGNDNRAYYTYYCLSQNADPAQVEAFVKRFYNIILGREADEKGLEDWTYDLLLKKKDASEVALGFVFSPEFTEKNFSDDEYVKRLYLAFFDRDYDEDGYNHWMSKLQSGVSRKEVLAGFVNSGEFKTLCFNYGINPGEMSVGDDNTANNQQQQNSNENNNSNNNDSNAEEDIFSQRLKLDSSNVDDTKLREYVLRLYVKILGRNEENVSEEEIAYWINAIKNGRDSEGREYDAATVARIGFLESQEYIQKGRNDEEFLYDMYRGFFDREPDAGGFEYWLNKMHNEGYTKQMVIDHGFGHSEEFKLLLESYGFRIIE